MSPFQLTPEVRQSILTSDDPFDRKVARDVEDLDYLRKHDDGELQRVSSSKSWIVQRNTFNACCATCSLHPYRGWGATDGRERNCDEWFYGVKAIDTILGRLAVR